MSFIDRLLRATPYLRRAYFQRDAAVAEARSLRAKLAGKLQAIAPDAREHYPDQMRFLLPGDDDRQDCQIGAFRAYIKRSIAKFDRTLEIGPSLNPIVPKSEGYDVMVLDHTDQAGLVEKYSAFGLDTTRIEPVDFVWSGGSLLDAVSKSRYDAVVASNVIEHAPDFIQFLTDCSRILQPTGALYLLVPDKRYCFDFFQPLSDVAKIMADHRMKRTRHSFESFYRLGMHANMADAIAWDQRGVEGLRFPHGDPKCIFQMAERRSTSEHYEDAHENYFTPIAFMMLIEELYYLGEIDLHLTTLTRARDSEFLAVLRLTGPSAETADRYMARRMAACKILMIEEMERILSIKA